MLVGVAAVIIIVMLACHNYLGHGLGDEFFKTTLYLLFQILRVVALIERVLKHLLKSKNDATLLGNDLFLALYMIFQQFVVPCQTAYLLRQPLIVVLET